MLEVVWLKEKRRLGFLVHRGAYYSIIRYRESHSEEHYELIENDEYEFYEPESD